MVVAGHIEQRVVVAGHKVVKAVAVAVAAAANRMDLPGAVAHKGLLEVQVELGHIDFHLLVVAAHISRLLVAHMVQQELAFVCISPSPVENMD